MKKISDWMLEQLMFWASEEDMTKEEAKQQKISFVYGNTKLHNQDITKELVEEICNKNDYLS